MVMLLELKVPFQVVADLASMHRLGEQLPVWMTTTVATTELSQNNSSCHGTALSVQLVQCRCVSVCVIVSLVLLPCNTGVLPNKP